MKRERVEDRGSVQLMRGDSHGTEGVTEGAGCDVQARTPTLTHTQSSPNRATSHFGPRH